MDGNNNSQPMQPQGPPPMPQPQPMGPPPAPGPQPIAPQGPSPMPMGQPGQPMMGPPNYQMPPKKGLSKGALWGIIGGSIGLVLLIIGVVLAVVFLGGPSRDDYRKAVTIVEDLNDSASDISSFDKTDDIEDAKKALNDHFSKIDTKKDELAKSAAMRDSEAKKLFDEFDKEYKKFRPAIEGYLESTGQYVDYTKKCGYSAPLISSTFDKTGEQVGAEYDRENKECADFLDELKKSSNGDIKKYAEDQDNYRKEMREYYVKMADRYSKKDYSSPLPKYPDYPRSESPFLSQPKEMTGNKADTKLEDLHRYLRKKANE